MNELLLSFLLLENVSSFYHLGSHASFALTGRELVERYLIPPASDTRMQPHLRLKTRVVAVTRQGVDKMKTPGREQAPFVLRLLRASDDEQDVLARAVIDASGTYETPNPLGAHGIPARGERALREHIFYGIPDILGTQRERYAGCRATTGFRPDLSGSRELRLALDASLESPAALAPLIDPNVHSCGTVLPHGVDELSHPEENFYIVGMKSYGRAPTFLTLTGYEQVRSIVSALTGDWEAARNVELVLPETGVCSTDAGGSCDVPSTPRVAGQDDLAEVLASCCTSPARQLLTVGAVRKHAEN